MSNLIEIVGIVHEALDWQTPVHGYCRSQFRTQIYQMKVAGLDPGDYFFRAHEGLWAGRWDKGRAAGIEAAKYEQLRKLIQTYPQPWFVRAELRKSDTDLYYFYAITEAKLYNKDGEDVESIPKTEIGGDPDPPESEQPEE